LAAAIIPANISTRADAISALDLLAGDDAYIDERLIGKLRVYLSVI
jgi:hypothetical protein